MLVILVASICLIAGFFLGRPYRRSVGAALSSRHSSGSSPDWCPVSNDQEQARLVKELLEQAQEKLLRDEVSSLTRSLKTWQEGYDCYQREAADLRQQVTQKQAAIQKAHQTLKLKEQAWNTQRTQLLTKERMSSQANATALHVAQQQVIEAHRQIAELQKAAAAFRMQQQPIACPPTRPLPVSVAQVTTHLVDLIGNHQHTICGCNCGSGDCLQHALVAHQRACKGHAEAQALIDAANALLHKCTMAKDATRLQALQLVEGRVRQYFRAMHASDAAQLLKYDTLEADYAGAAAKVLEATAAALLAGTNFCGQSALQLHLSDVLKQWLVHADKHLVLGGAQQVHRLVDEATTLQQGINVGVIQAIAGHSSQHCHQAQQSGQLRDASFLSSLSISPRATTAASSPSYTTSKDRTPAHPPSTPVYGTSAYRRSIPAAPASTSRTAAPSSHQFSVGPHGGLKYKTSTGTVRYVSQNRPATVRRLRDEAGF